MTWFKERPKDVRRDRASPEADDADAVGPRLIRLQLEAETIMKIADLRLTGLAGGTVEGGWAEELKPEDNLHTIVEVITDEGLVGIGSAMTSRALVEAARQSARGRC